MKLNAFNLQELTWDEVASDIKKQNQNLFNAIMASAPPKKCTLIKATYAYGEKIIEDGMLYLPDKYGRSLPISSLDINEKIKKKLKYSSIPLAILLNKASEVFLNRKDAVTSLKLLCPGKLFGLFEVTNLLSDIKEKALWSVSSGARNLFMLPKIADKVGYQRIKKTLNLQVDAPRALSEHWQIFSTLCKHPDHISHWQSEVLFFTDAWFEGNQKNLKMVNFYNYLFKESNLQRHYTHNDIEFDLNWQNFITALGKQNLRPRPYLLDTAKHLFAIGKGALPGFKAADSNDIVAPIQLLQNIYVDIYGLRNYLPILMHSYNLMKNTITSPVYYSLSFPSVLEGLPSYKTAMGGIISDMRFLKKLSDISEALINSDENNSYQVRYEYFHSEPDMYHEIQLATEIAIQDSTLLADKIKFPERVFCATAPFLSGCVRITRTV